MKEQQNVNVTYDYTTTARSAQNAGCCTLISKMSRGKPPVPPSVAPPAKALLRACSCYKGGGASPVGLAMAGPTAWPPNHVYRLLRRSCVPTISYTNCMKDYMYGMAGRNNDYSQTSLIRSSFVRIPRHPEENSWLQIYSIRDASNITGVRLSGSLAYPDFFVENRCVRLSEV